MYFYISIDNFMLENTEKCIMYSITEYNIPTYTLCIDI